jgi:hypothetical protein
MSWKITFQLGSELIEVIINKNDIMFFDVGTGQITGLTGIRYDKSGVIKEFPDLENDDEWRKKAIERLREKIKTFDTEEQKMEYIINDLKKYDYKPLMKQRSGWRPQKI